MKNQIIKMYFEDGLKQIEISKILNISKYKVSRILVKDIRYEKEKETRKNQNKKKHIEDTKKYVAKIRKSKNIDIDYSRMIQDHIQATRELSGGKKPMNNRTFRNCNPSIYQYNNKSNCYILKKGVIVGADVPKRISWKNY